MTDLDLFSCAGGATTGLAMLGRTVVGVDHDADACRTHLAAGHPTIRADLTAPVPVCGPFDMVWASPPCTAFSMAGKGAGRDVTDVLIGRILAENWEPMDLDPTVWLILPTMRALLELGPTAIAMENVPPTLPVMHACAQVLERHGWHTAVGVLSAERFGVAQTRKRAFLIANREHRVQMPEPTHQGYGDESDGSQGALFGEPLLPWISMAEALGWCGVIQTRGNRAPTGGNYFDTDGPSWALTEKARSWLLDRRQNNDGVAVRLIPASEPAASITSSGLQSALTWRHSAGTTKLAADEAARLQAFPNGHPWAGSRTSIFRQIGNAVPAPVAAWVAGAALDMPREQIKAAVFGYLEDLYGQPLQREEAA